MNRSTVEWVRAYQARGALWIHDGNPLRPHALLTSGKHSDGFFNSERVMEDPLLLDEAAADLVELLQGQGLDFTHVDRVVGPAMGAITLAHDLARQIGQRRGYPCLRAYTEKDPGNPRGPMVFSRTMVSTGEWILATEDVLTTGSSVVRMNIAIMQATGIVLPFVVVLVNRSGITNMNGNRIVALIDHPMALWTPEECPLCKQGSEVLRPKGTENWARLNAVY